MYMPAWRRMGAVLLARVLDDLVKGALVEIQVAKPPEWERAWGGRGSAYRGGGIIKSPSSGRGGERQSTTAVKADGDVGMRNGEWATFRDIGSPRLDHFSV